MLTGRTPNLSDGAPRPCPTLVLGLGNLLLRDEGVGVRVVQALERTRLPPGVEVVDGATAGLTLVDTLVGRRKVIVIDAFAGHHPPGTVSRLLPADLAPCPARGVSLHEVGFLEALAATRHLGAAPEEVVIFGVQPQNVACGLELSAEVAQCVPEVVELVLAEVRPAAPAAPASPAPNA